MRALRAKINESWHVGRTVVVVGGAVGVAAFGFWLLSGSNVYAAFMKAALADGLTMALAAGIERFWSGARVQDVEMGPDGAVKIGFEDSLKKVTDALAALNERMNEQIGVLNKRVYELEASARDEELATDDKQGVATDEDGEGKE